MPASEMSRRILILDANATAAAALARLLGLEGHRVVVAKSVSEAHDRCDADAFDLVITDVAFRDGSGLDVLARARDKGADVRGIVLTGHEDKAYQAAAAQAGFDAYLLKPIDWQRLRTLIVRLLPARVDSGREHRAPAAYGPTLD